MTDERQLLKEQGFEGFKTVNDLMTGGKSLLPAQMGVYVLLRENSARPIFLTEGTGGFFKGKNPNVSISELENNWIDETSIVYIGKAGGIGSSATLQSRLGQYMRFGQGKNVGHWGGRYIWQLADSKELIVCWKTLSDVEPRTIEQQMISEFKSEHSSKRPFANLVD